MSRAPKSVRRARTACAAVCALLAGACAVGVPAPALALGGPQPVTVSAEGAVRTPGSYILPADATLSVLIAAAGGFTDEADLRGAVLARRSARALQEAELREMAVGLARAAGSSETAQRVVRSAEGLLASVRPAGRVPATVTYARLLKNTPQDLRLEDGDVLRVPAAATAVAVTGAVANASGTIPFVPGLRYEEYIRRAGGYAADADRSEVFLLRADGTTALLSVGPIRWNPEAGRWEVTALTGGPPAVRAGDTIVVYRSLPPGLPSKFERELFRVLVRASEIGAAPVVLP